MKLAKVGTCGLLLAAILIALGMFAAKPKPPSKAGDTIAAGRRPVLLELFTSEGCSSCPPADRLLETFDRTQPVSGADLIVLSEHVDYWNRLGWTDPFSSALFTQRQQDYVTRFHLDGAYTPQLVIDGQKDVVGSDERAARSAILKAGNALQSCDRPESAAFRSRREGRAAGERGRPRDRCLRGAGGRSCAIAGHARRKFRSYFASRGCSQDPASGGEDRCAGSLSPGSDVALEGREQRSLACGRVLAGRCFQTDPRHGPGASIKEYSRRQVDHTRR